MEAFSDGVVAIIITVMVLEMRAPCRPELPALRPAEFDGWDDALTYFSDSGECLWRHYEKAESPQRTQS
jgi:hypothetical protein